MFLGSIANGSAYMQMIWELLANSLDLHLAGHCKTISIEIGEGGAITVEDDGQGFPIHPVGEVPFAELAFTSLHKTPTLDGHTPHIHVGVHGIGVVVVSAFSAWLELETSRDGRLYQQRFEAGIPTSRLRDTGPTDRRGTRITFLPDPIVFPNFTVNSDTLTRRLREISFILPELSLSFRDNRKHVYRNPTGLSAFVDYHGRDLHLPPMTETFELHEESGEILVDVAARWWADAEPHIESFANVERTTEGGSHVRGLTKGLAEGFRQFARKKCTGLPSERLIAALSKGLCAVVCVRLTDARYEGPVRNQLSTPAAETAVKTVVSKAFPEFLEQNKELGRWVLSQLRK